MEAEIKLIIEKNLPSHVGEVLKKTLQQADADAAELKNFKKAVIGRDKTITELTTKLETYKKFDERNAALTANESILAESQRTLKIKELEYQLVAEKSNTKFAQDVAPGLVRNTTYRKSVFDSENQGGFYDNAGVWRQPSPTSKSMTEEKKIE